MTRNIQHERLSRLAYHLEHQQLAHDEFRFDTYGATENHDLDGVRTCKTMGCAISELPAVFPDDWEFVTQFGGNKIPSPTNGRRCIEEAAIQFFGIDGEEYAHLFLPDTQNPAKYGGILLHENATKEHVANNIRAFITMARQNGEIL